MWAEFASNSVVTFELIRNVLVVLRIGPAIDRYFDRIHLGFKHALKNEFKSKTSKEEMDAEKEKTGGPGGMHKKWSSE